MIEWSKYTDRWAEVKAAARTTIGKEGEGLPPTASWKKTILLCEHSPIRKIRFAWEWINLKSWISVHFVRHWVGILHWVSTQRTDRTGINRDELPQDAPVMHECEANAQALINISRRRLCRQAAPETREAWLEVRRVVEKHDPILASVMVPECIYRGFCPEFKSCGYCHSDQWWTDLNAYRDKGVQDDAGRV